VRTAAPIALQPMTTNSSESRYSAGSHDGSGCTKGRTRPATTRMPGSSNSTARWIGTTISPPTRMFAKERARERHGIAPS
jgi:hypothetical protein